MAVYIFIYVVSPLFLVVVVVFPLDFRSRELKGIRLRQHHNLAAKPNERKWLRPQVLVLNLLCTFVCFFVEFEKFGLKQIRCSKVSG